MDECVLLFVFESNSYWFWYFILFHFVLSPAVLLYLVQYVQVSSDGGGVYHAAAAVASCLDRALGQLPMPHTDRP